MGSFGVEMMPKGMLARPKCESGGIGSHDSEDIVDYGGSGEVKTKTKTKTEGRRGASWRGEGSSTHTT